MQTCCQCFQQEQSEENGAYSPAAAPEEGMEESFDETSYKNFFGA